MSKIWTFDKDIYLDDLIDDSRIKGFRALTLPGGVLALQNSMEVVEYEMSPTEHGNYIKVLRAYCYVPNSLNRYAGEYDVE